MSFSNINIQNFIIEKRMIVGDSLLDIGAGHGALAYLMQRDQEYRNVEKSGLDIVPEAMEFNKKHKLYEFFLSPESFTEEERKYDTVVALELLEHLIPYNPPLEEILQKMESIAKKRVIISVPAPYMTINIPALKKQLEDLNNINECSNDSTIALLADMHKQIIYPSVLKQLGFKKAKSYVFKTINGSMIFYKDVESKEKPITSRTLKEMIFPENYLDMAKEYYCSSREVSNKRLLETVIISIMKQYKYMELKPFLPALNYYLKRAIYIMLKFA